MLSKHRVLLRACCLAIAAGAFASVTAMAGASNISIINPDFNLVYENANSSATGIIPANTYSSGLGITTFNNKITYLDGTQSLSGFVPGWYSAGSSGEQNIGAAGTRAAGDYGYAQTAIVSQTLSTDVTPGETYLLSAGADTRYANGPTTMNLIMGGTQMAGIFYGNPGGYHQATAPINEIVVAPLNASGALGIQLGNGSGQSIFNNVTLTQNPTTGPTVINNAFNVNFLTAAPTVGSADQSNLSPTAAATTSTNPNYYTNNPNGAPGETFTTGSASSYNLNSITVLDQSEHGGFHAGANITLALYSVSGTNFAVQDVLSAMIGTSGLAASGDYIELTLNSPITLKGSSVYGYGIISSNGYSGLGVDPNADYAGGSLAMFGLGGLTTSAGAPNAIFDVGLTAVPEPATLALLGLGSLALAASSRKRTRRA